MADGGFSDPSRAKWWIAVGVTLASAMELVDTTIVNVGMPDISASLGATIDEVAWMWIGYLLSAVIVLPLTTAALSELTGHDLAEGASMFDPMRQLGGSVGISMLASHGTTSIAVARATRRACHAVRSRYPSAARSGPAHTGSRGR